MKKFSLYSRATVAFGLLSLSPTIFAKGQVSYSYLGRMNTPLQENIGSQFIELDLSDSQDKHESNAGWDVVYQAQFRHYPGSNSQIYAVPEAYLETKVNSHEWSIGRKIIPWQHNGKFWAMGEVNPIRGFNLIETKREGLMGVHYRHRSKHWQVMVQVSPINIPQVNPTFTEKNGKITGNNEWSYPPPQYVRYRNNDVPIHYTLVYPDMKDIILKNSGSFALDYKFEQGKVGIYGGFKPEPGIRINATGYYEQFNQERALVKAKPFVNNHYFWGGSFDYQFNPVADDHKWTTSVGVEGVVPKYGKDDSFEFAALKIKPTYNRVTYSTFSLSYESRTTKLSLNGLYLIDGDIINYNVFAKKPKWRRAIGFSGYYSPIAKVKLNAIYRFDFKTRDMTMRSEVQYLWTRHVNIAVGIQLISAPKLYSFWAPYRSNDTLFSRVSYLF